jgi:hypothetical protein
MSTFLGILASLAALFGAFFLALMFFAVGESGNAGATLLLYSVLSSGAAIALGVLGLVLGRPSPSRFCSFGVGLGVTTLLALAVVYLVF